MKISLLILAMWVFLAFAVSAQTKKDGTPDMRYKANKEAYGSSYSTPKSTYTPSRSTYSTPRSAYQSERNYSNGGRIRTQKGYLKKDGTYVSPHLKTSPDNKKWNNLKQRKNNWSGVLE